MKEKHRRPGRPEKPEDERLTHYIYVRMHEKTWNKIMELAEVNSFEGRGKISNTIRWAVDKMHALKKGKTNAS